MENFKNDLILLNIKFDKLKDNRTGVLALYSIIRNKTKYFTWKVLHNAKLAKLVKHFVWLDFFNEKL